jgi:glycosyltransferase involved in cell wall biosynthesis
MINVAFDDQIFAMQSHGGISRYFAELIRHFRQLREVDANVIAPLYCNRHLRDPALVGCVRGCYIAASFRGRRPVLEALNAAMRPFAWASLRFDVLHETYYSKRPAGRARVRIATLHDMIHELFPARFTRGVVEAKRAAILRADHVICVSENTRRDATRLLGLPTERLTVIHLASSLPIRAADDLQPQPGRPYFLYVGPRNSYKNFSATLHAFEASASLRVNFELVAFGGGEFTRHERASIRRMGLTGVVRQAAGDDEQLRLHYAGAVALVYPSLYEGFGMPPLEAMSSGCPVACSTAGSLKEVVGDAGLYFEPTDTEALRRVLEQLAAELRTRDALRARGYEQARRFSWTRCAEETLATYRRALQLAS